MFSLQGNYIIQKLLIIYFARSGESSLSINSLEATRFAVFLNIFSSAVFYGL